MTTDTAETLPTAQRVGRPSKYSPDVVTKVCEAIADGVPFKFAAALAGISQDTLCEWRRNIPEFAESIQAALASGIRARLRLIQQAAEKGDVKAATWWLEHVFPEHFARNRIEVEHSGTVSHLVISPAQLTAIAESRKRYETDGTDKK